MICRGLCAAFYNAFFTALPVGAFAIFDRPVRLLSTLQNNPQVGTLPQHLRPVLPMRLLNIAQETALARNAMKIVMLMNFPIALSGLACAHALLLE